LCTHADTPALKVDTAKHTCAGDDDDDDDEARQTKKTVRESHSDTSLIRDIYCGPEVLFVTCVAMKFMDDD